MKNEEREFFKRLLEDQLNGLMACAGITVSGLLNESGSAADPLDRASIDTDRNYTLRIRDRESRLIRKIRRALESIEDGTYGICEMCDEEIAIPRLKARPVTSYCINCKRKLEEAERVYQ